MLRNVGLANKDNTGTPSRKDFSEWVNDAFDEIQVISVMATGEQTGYIRYNALSASTP